MVQGHVDGVGEIVSIEREEDAVWYRIRASKDILKYVVTKGYIAIDGTSLTVCDVDEESFTIMMIPHTQSIVIMPTKEVGDGVNLEVDITGKYIEKFMAMRG